MKRYRVSPQARADMADLTDYYRPLSPKFLVRLKRAILTKFRVIGTSPLLGSPAQVRTPGVRRVTAMKHTILYQPTPTGVMILRVIDGRRLIDDSQFDSP